MKYTSRADLLIAAGESIKMQEKAGNAQAFKAGGKKFTLSLYAIASEQENDIEFPIAIVEGKPVFAGDELYCKDGCKHKIASVSEDGFLVEDNARASLFTIDFMSWNQPKPNTILVELLVEDAQTMADAKSSGWIEFDRLTIACRKALESQK